MVDALSWEWLEGAGLMGLILITLPTLASTALTSEIVGIACAYQFVSFLLSAKRCRISLHFRNYKVLRHITLTFCKCLSSNRRGILDISHGLSNRIYFLFSLWFKDGSRIP